MALSNPSFFMPMNFPCASPLPAEPSPDLDDSADDPDAESKSTLSHDELVPVADDDTSDISSTSLDDLISDACERTNECDDGSRT